MEGLFSSTWNGRGQTVAGRVGLVGGDFFWVVSKADVRVAKGYSEESLPAAVYGT